ncbi:MAG: hypothetical protein NTY48_04810 [Candidatus Diapherotrites archaeon]|nr:hypothetical protein [Candidatus Diapherotrites archaeon]
MNARGNFLIIAIILMIGAVVLLPVLMAVFPPIDILVKIFLVFSIFMMVRGYLGNGVLTIIISGVLIYFLVIKWWWVGASGWMAITLISLSVFSVILWGSQAITMFAGPKRR